MKSLSVSKDKMTTENDFKCTYCDTTDTIKSCKVQNALELLCTNCGRYGEATHNNGTIQTGPFFTAI